VRVRCMELSWLQEGALPYRLLFLLNLRLGHCPVDYNKTGTCCACIQHCSEIASHALSNPGSQSEDRPMFLGCCLMNMQNATASCRLPLCHALQPSCTFDPLVETKGSGYRCTFKAEFTVVYSLACCGHVDPEA
jgi:hypothetical protein